METQSLKITALIKRSVYFTENSGYQSLKNRSCVTVFGSCSATLTVGEPLGDVFGSVNHNFRTSVTRISGEIDFSLINRLHICTYIKLCCSVWSFLKKVIFYAKRYLHSIHIYQNIVEHYDCAH